MNVGPSGGAYLSVVRTALIHVRFSLCFVPETRHRAPFGFADLTHLDGPDSLPPGAMYTVNRVLALFFGHTVSPA